MVCYYNKATGMVILDKTLYPKGITMPSLNFITAIEFSRIIEYELDFLSEKDFPNLFENKNFNDPYNIERNNYNQINQINNTNEKVFFIQTLIDKIAQANSNFTIKETDPPPHLPKGDFSVCLNFSSKDSKTPNVVSKIKGSSITEHGKINETEFMQTFITTEVYETVFRSQGLNIVPIDKNSRGVIRNFCNIGIDIYPSPDFGVVNTKGDIIGFIEYKSRISTPFEYDNVYNKDVMQTAMYTLLTPSRCKVWTIQNYSNDKFFVNCYSEDNIINIINSIIKQYGTIANYVLDNTNRDKKGKIVSIPSWEYLINLRDKNTSSFKISREFLLRYIIRDAKLRSIYKRENVEVNKASYQAKLVANRNPEIYKKEYTKNLKQIRDEIQEIVKKVKIMHPSELSGEKSLFSFSNNYDYKKFKYSEFNKELNDFDAEVNTILETNGFIDDFGFFGGIKNFSTIENFQDPKFIQGLPNTLFKDELENIFRVFEISGNSF